MNTIIWQVCSQFNKLACLATARSFIFLRVLQAGYTCSVQPAENLQNRTGIVSRRPKRRKKNSNNSKQTHRKKETICPACEDTVEIDLSPGEYGHCPCGALVLLDGNQLVDKSCSKGTIITLSGIAITGLLIMCCGDSFYGKPFPGQEEHFARVRFWSFVVGATIELGALAGFAWAAERVTPLQLLWLIFRRSTPRKP